MYRDRQFHRSNFRTLTELLMDRWKELYKCTKGLYKDRHFNCITRYQKGFETLINICSSRAASSQLKTYVISSETRPLLGHFWNKGFFCFLKCQTLSIGLNITKKCKKKYLFPPKLSNTCKNFQNPKIAGKWLSIGPPHFFHPNFFLPKWLRMA